jgi:hypothetical protein
VSAVRHYPETPEDLAEVERLNVQPWMVEMLKRNPSYVHWGLGEDYMQGPDDDGGWASGVELERWDPWTLNDLNECVHGYFYLQRASVNCESCDGSGLNAATHQLSEDWYDFAGTGRKWCYSLGEAEVAALVRAGRLSDLMGGRFVFFDDAADAWVAWVEGEKVAVEPPAFPSPAEVNAWAQRGNGIGHDAINRWICVRARAESLGVYGDCPSCGGTGSRFTEPAGHLALQLWMLVPRKGASRGLVIKDVLESDVPAIEEFFREATRRSISRFSMLAGGAA